MRRALRVVDVPIAILLSLSTVAAQPVIHSVTTNSDTVGLYNKFELTIDLSASYTNPFDGDEIALQVVFTSPSSKLDTVDGFYYQDFTGEGRIIATGPPVWKTRFAPAEIGTWTYEVEIMDRQGTTSQPVKLFMCVSSTNSGFLRKTNSAFLRFDDNTAFFAVGENMAWGDSVDPISDYRKWMGSLSANGGNYIRVWMPSWGFALEWNDTGLGNYEKRLDRAYQLDWVLENAQRQGIRVQLSLNNSGQLSTEVNPEWRNNPYNAANGGPLGNPASFFTNQTSKDLFKRRLRYIIARWGYSTNLLAWELFNEIDLIDNYANSLAEIAAWHDEMAHFILNKDPNKHLITTSFSNAHSMFEPAIWNLNSLDYTQIHHFNIVSDAPSDLYDITQFFLQEYNKPTMVSECCFPGFNLAVNEDPRGILLHNSLWASAFSGAMGTAAIWWWDLYVDPLDLYHHFAPVASFMASVDLLGQEFARYIPETNSSARVDFTVKPGFDFAKPPSDIFNVSPRGSISPPASMLSAFLFGTVFNTDLRNPPTFHVDYEQAGDFRVVTGTNTSVSPLMEIWLDGTKVLEQAGATNTTYTISVPAGSHDIFVDNQGTDWIEIQQFIFSNYTAMIGSVALQGENAVIGWVRNRNYNWRYVRDFGLPQPIEDGTVVLKGLSTGGLYDIEWWSSSTGEIVAITTEESDNGILALNVPHLQWDFGYKVSPRESPTAINSPVATAPEKFALYQNYPNPFNPTTNIVFALPVKARVVLKVFDLLGREVATLVDRELPAGIHKVLFDAQGLPSGVYFYRIQAGEFAHTKRLVLLK